MFGVDYFAKRLLNTLFFSYLCKKKNMDSIKNRRSIRKYKQDEIPASLLNDLLEEAFRASTMGNMQLYSVVVTRDKQMKEKLAPAHFNQPMVTGAPVVLTFVPTLTALVNGVGHAKRNRDMIILSLFECGDRCIAGYTKFLHIGGRTWVGDLLFGYYYL